MSPAKTVISVRSLNKVHQDLNELFVRHQIYLMRRDIEGALVILRELHEKYTLHIHDEEALLLPVYKQKVKPIPPGGAVEFYIQEHKKIKRMLDEFVGKVAGWHKKDNFTPLHLVRLFDRHYTFRDLLNHHHAREDTFLYRWLDRLLNTADIKAIFTKMEQIPDNIKSLI